MSTKSVHCITLLEHVKYGDWKQTESCLYQVAIPCLADRHPPSLRLIHARATYPSLAAAAHEITTSVIIFWKEIRGSTTCRLRIASTDY